MSLGSRKGAEISGNSQVIWNMGSLPHSFAYGRNCASVQFSSVASVVSDSVQLHRWKPTRLPYSWNSQGKNTGVGLPFPSPMHESEK